jgi:hypothetical protein
MVTELVRVFALGGLGAEWIGEVVDGMEWVVEEVDGIASGGDGGEGTCVDVSLVGFDFFFLLFL